MSPKVCIILVNYNGYLNTVECLESVLKLNYGSFNVIVVDNSTDDSFDRLNKWSKEPMAVETNYRDLVLPYVSKPIDCIFATEDNLENYSSEQYSVLFIKAKENKGFAAGNNLALKFISRFDYQFVWLLNNDTVVERNTLLELVKTAEFAVKKTGMWGSKLMMYYERGLIQGVGGYYNKWIGRVKEIGFREQDRGQWDNVQFDFNYVIGASMFIRKEFISDVGLMEEDYFLYYEELDWAIRGKQRGWDLGYSPGSIVYHKIGASINKDMAHSNSELSDFYSARNRIILTKKYFPLALVTLYPAFLKFVMNRIRSRQFSRILMLLKTIFNPVKHLR